MPRLLELTHIEPQLASRIEAQIDEVALVIETQLASDLPAVNTLCGHIERYRGKMLRPTMVLLSGLAAAPDPSDPHALTDHHRVVGAVTELIHMATLVHDDVLDDALIRRRGQTINAMHGNETAVMLGDYLISNAFHLCSSIGDPSVNLALGAVTNTLCEGELLQLHNRNQYGIDEPTYFEIVTRKTASLIGEACRLGAQLSGASLETRNALCRAGIALGIAFQIQDDVLDLVGDQRVVGKSLGKDLDKGKLTLPLILHLSSASPTEREASLALLISRDAPALRKRLLGSGVVEACTTRAHDYVEEAKSLIAYLPASPVRELFVALADRIVERRF